MSMVKEQCRHYLLAFGPFRHRAWVVGMRSRGCSLGSFERPLAGLLEVVSKPLGGYVGASWGLFWASWGPLGASWEPLGVFWGRLGAEGSDFRLGLPLLGPSWGRLGALLGRVGSLLGRLGALLGRFGRLLGASWAVLGRSWGSLGPSSTP